MQWIILTYFLNMYITYITLIKKNLLDKDLSFGSYIN